MLLQRLVKPTKHGKKAGVNKTKPVVLSSKWIEIFCPCTLVFSSRRCFLTFPSSLLSLPRANLSGHPKQNTAQARVVVLVMEWWWWWWSLGPSGASAAQLHGPSRIRASSATLANGRHRSYLSTGMEFKPHTPQSGWTGTGNCRSLGEPKFSSVHLRGGAVFFSTGLKASKDAQGHGLS